MAKLFRVIVPVLDLERAARFYSLVLELDGRRVSAGRLYYDCEGTILACYDAAADGDTVTVRPLPEPLYLAVDDLEAAYARARQAGASFADEVVPGVGPLGRIATRPWGERSFYVTDPFGNPLCFVSRPTALTTGVPPDPAAP
jgi:catechol 2,3-dioxygenase-like lactoylglutathione lyase family enzyme